MAELTFSTARLRAEVMARHHADYLASLDHDEDVMALVGGVRTDEQSAAWLERNLAHWAENGFGQWMFRTIGGDLVGRGGLRWIDECVGERLVEVGYVFERSAWGRGFATEATAAIVEVARDCYSMERLGGIALDGNNASNRVLEKCGFLFVRWVDHPVGPHRLFTLDLNRGDATHRGQ